MTEIVIVDDHPLVREGIRKVVQKKASDIKVVGEASSTSELLNLLAKKMPDIVLLDITLPGRSGIDVLQDLKKMYSTLPVLILSMHPENRFAIRALKAGAAGYLNKTSVSDKLILAINTIVKQKRRYITEEVGEELAEQLSNGETPSPHQALSDREFQVLSLITQGKDMNEIADELLLSIQTIYTYRTRIKEKMNLESNAQLIRYGIEHDLVE